MGAAPIIVKTILEHAITLLHHIKALTEAHLASQPRRVPPRLTVRERTLSLPRGAVNPLQRQLKSLLHLARQERGPSIHMLWIELRAFGDVRGYRIEDN